MLISFYHETESKIFSHGVSIVILHSTKILPQQDVHISARSFTVRSLVKLSLCFIKHQVMKAYVRRMEVQLNVFLPRHQVEVSGSRVGGANVAAAAFLGAFAKLLKATISFVMSVRLSVRPGGTARLLLDGF